MLSWETWTGGVRRVCVCRGPSDGGIFTKLSSMKWCVGPDSSEPGKQCSCKASSKSRQKSKCLNLRMEGWHSHYSTRMQKFVDWRKWRETSLVMTNHASWSTRCARKFALSRSKWTFSTKDSKCRQRMRNMATSEEPTLIERYSNQMKRNLLKQKS